MLVSTEVGEVRLVRSEVGEFRLVRLDLDVGEV